ncbi:MAG: aminotransferase class I/II-fold pyridoxal phosphate-dependent enzyme [Rikenellaceae bacterium]
MINGHGNNIYQYDRDIIEADFSSNIAFNNHSDEILSFLSGNMDSLRNYPDPAARRLTEKIATFHGVDTKNITVANGSAEVFYMVAHYLTMIASPTKCRTIITTPSFSEYEDSCKLHGHEISYVELRDIKNIDTTNFDSLWLASPNNPDGYRVYAEDIYDLAARNRECLIILDRAYNALSTDGEVCCKLPDNVLLVESFTKYYGIPGLRLGYIVGAEDIISSITPMRPPWSVNSLSIVAGEYILDNMEMLQIDLEELIGESHYLQESINEIEGLRVVRSNCNFFLVEIEGGILASELYEYLLHKHGLLVRDCSNFRDLGSNFIRIAAQSRLQNDKLINALRGWR